ncbi:MarR family transcriptional regulator [Sulfitobacter albidus]|uniref:MarR family transcriptional regulator n=1 Tax=Sulfitobacter albidus TaxID=2829501 RepID=A0A975JFX7_9RHOB|nr:MarR family transcriptional regulator [Sulfitobacter albidus]QUJ77471.1 MarR family transcriptional regulator [Sulfitobacter albidus]
MTQLAVFTGDIVKSSDLDAATLDAVFATLRAGAEQIGGWSGATAPFARFRGDGWQMALPPRDALRGALVLRARVRSEGAETRIGIGIGDARLTGTDLAAAEGPAFVTSGHSLDTLKRSLLMQAPDGPLSIALPLADRIARTWTPKQAQTIAALLDPAPPTQEALGATLNRSKQMIQKQAEAAGIDALHAACAAYEAQW